MPYGPALETLEGHSIHAEMMEYPPGSGELVVRRYVIILPPNNVLVYCRNRQEAKDELSRIARAIKEKRDRNEPEEGDDYDPPGGGRSF